MKHFIFIFSFLLTGFGLSVAVAEEQPDVPKKNEVLEATADFMKDFDDRSKRHFSVLYGNHNLVKIVESVRENVEMAVDACGEKNPDMKEPLKTRFKEWEAAVDPVIEEAEANVHNMILAQEYVQARAVKKFLKFVDKKRKEKDKEVEKVPVTSPEACEHLLKGMDETQPDMVRLLKTTLVSLPIMMQVEDDEERAAQEAAEQEAAEKAKAEAEAEVAKEEANEDVE